jgi:hypothetical protein
MQAGDNAGPEANVSRARPDADGRAACEQNFLMSHRPVIVRLPGRAHLLQLREALSDGGLSNFSDFRIHQYRCGESALSSCRARGADAERMQKLHGVSEYCPARGRREWA